MTDNRTPQPEGFSRRRRSLSGALAVLILISVATPAAADQIALPFDPSQNFAQIGQGWFTALQGLALNLYVTLFTIELIIVGYHAALYKDNIAEFFQTFVWKFGLAMAMLAIIGNAGSIFPKIVNMFQWTAIDAIGSAQSNAPTEPTNAQLPTLPTSCGYAGQGVPPADCSMSNPTGLEVTLLGWAAPFFVAADMAKGADSAAASGTGILVVGNGDLGLANALVHGHDVFEMFCLALGMTLVVAAMTVFFTYLLLTFEVQIVLSIGVVFLAFQGSRFTAQYASGYMSYAINVGTKMFVFYFVIAILGQVFQPNAANVMTTLASLTGAAYIPSGVGAVAIAAAASPIPLMAIVGAGLIAAVPNFTSSLLSGSSALSAGAAMGQLTQALSTAGGIQASRRSLALALANENDARRTTERQRNAYELVRNASPIHVTPDVQTGARRPAPLPGEYHVAAGEGNLEPKNRARQIGAARGPTHHARGHRNPRALSIAPPVVLRPIEDTAWLSSASANRVALGGTLTGSDTASSSDWITQPEPTLPSPTHAPALLQQVNDPPITPDPGLDATAEPVPDDEIRRAEPRQRDVAATTGRSIERAEARYARAERELRERTQARDEAARVVVSAQFASFGGFIPQSTPQPAAVQIRVSNPDRPQ